MSSRIIAIRTLAVIVFTTTGFVAFAPHATSGKHALRYHTHLVKSEPADHDTLAQSPRAVRLWFTQQVELAVTSVKLADAAGHAERLESLARPDSGKEPPVVASLKAPLKPGDYIVSWSTAALDGHPAKGAFAFVVRATR